MEFAQSLRQIMESKSVTMYRLAKELGVHQTTVKNWLNGKGEPSISQFRRIALALGVEEVDFMLTTEEKERYVSSYIDWVKEHPEEAKELAEKYPHPAPTPEKSRRNRLLAFYDHVLSPMGQEKAAEAVEIIAGNPEYQRIPASPPPAAPLEGTDTTSTPDAAEGPQEGE